MLFRSHVYIEFVIKLRLYLETVVSGLAFISWSAFCALGTCQKDGLMNRTAYCRDMIKTDAVYYLEDQIVLPVLAFLVVPPSRVRQAGPCLLEIRQFLAV